MDFWFGPKTPWCWGGLDKRLLGVLFQRGGLDKRLLGVRVVWTKDSLVLIQPWLAPRSLLSKPPQHQGVFCPNHPFEREHQGVFCSNHPNTKESFVQTTPQNFKGHFPEFTFSTKESFVQIAAEFSLRVSISRSRRDSRASERGALR